MLGNDSAVYYMSPFCNNTVHRDQGFDFVDIGHWTNHANANGAQNHLQPELAETTPADTERFYAHLMGVAKESWGMEMLFIDFLCLRAPHLATAMPETFEAGSAWLRGVGDAAAALGVELQFCMACPHQALTSLDIPAATNARVNGDSGMAVPDMVYSSALAASVGLGWSKDNLRLMAFQQGAAPSQGATEVQVIFAALSLGPAGLADRLEGWPAVAKEGTPVVTNRTLAMSLCAANGALLQPSFPLTAVEAQLAGALAADAAARPTWTQNAFATFTTVGNHTSFVATAFTWRQSASAKAPGAGSWTLRPSDLSTLIDCEDYPPAAFHEVPNGAYRDSSSHQCLFSPAAAHPGSVVWVKGASTAAMFSWAEDTGVEMALSESPQLAYISPVQECGIALLGEEGKVAPISVYRFSAIDSSAAGLHVSLRGAAGEEIALLYVRLSAGLAVRRMTVVIEASGTASATIPTASATRLKGDDTKVEEGASLIGEGRVYRPVFRDNQTEIFTYDGGQPGYLSHFYAIDSCELWQGMRLRYYIDGEAEPSIDVDLAIMHSIGWFQTAKTNASECLTRSCTARCITGGEPWQADLFGKSSMNGIWNDFKIPFSSAVRVTLQLPEDAAVEKASLYTNVRGVAGPSLASGTLAVGDLQLPLASRPRLHVFKYAGQDVAPMTHFDIFATNRSGVLLLSTLIVSSATRGFMGSCVRAFVGGNSTRAPNDFDVLLGTGTEDYFDSANGWFNLGLDRPYHGSDNGLTHWNHNDGVPSAQVTEQCSGRSPPGIGKFGPCHLAAYKLHHKDEVRFDATKPLRVTYRNGEPLGSRDTAKRCAREDSRKQPPRPELSPMNVTSYVWSYQW